MEVISLGISPGNIGCYKRRIGQLNGELIISSENKVVSVNNEEILSSDSQIYDFSVHNNTVFTISATGRIYSSAGRKNTIESRSGLCSAIETTATMIAGSHDISHTVRFVDYDTLETINSVTLPGMSIGLAQITDDTFFEVDGRTVSVLDAREKNPVVSRSLSLSSDPVSLCSFGDALYVACEDRRVRVFDSKRMKSPLITTKPITKNGVASMVALEKGTLLCLGPDESCVVARTDEEIGQLKRKKYLAESPWISAPTRIDDAFYALTKDMKIHRLN